MDKLAFTVFDSAANMYLEPFFAPTIEFAIRGFREAVNKEGHQFNTYPEDYTLYHIGSFDPEQGVFLAMDPRSLGVAITFKVPPQQLNLMEGTNDA